MSAAHAAATALVLAGACLSQHRPAGPSVEAGCERDAIVASTIGRAVPPTPRQGGPSDGMNGTPWALRYQTPTDDLVVIDKEVVH